METQSWRRYKETETRRKLVDKTLERGIGIEEETKKWKNYMKNIEPRKKDQKLFSDKGWRTETKDAGKKRKIEKIWAKNWTIYTEQDFWPRPKEDLCRIKQEWD